MIGYAGLSHLGLISSLAAGDKGFDTVGFDPDRSLVDGINAGRFNVSEPSLDELYDRTRAKVAFSADPRALGDCQVVYVAVDVPTDPSGRSDVAPVLSLVRQVTAATRPGTVIVVLSQVHPGFTRQLRPAVRATGHELLYQVETLIFGRAVERALHPERYIVGTIDPAAPLPEPMDRFLRAFDCPILPMRLESAELTKIAINMFLVSSVSTTNLLAEVCERIGADWSEIAPALRLDKRIGQHAYLGAGLGIGGSNLGRDMATIKMLAGDHGTDARLIDAWRGNSTYRRDWALREVHRRVLDASPHPTIAVWGLAYKEDTHSTFNSPSIELLTALTPYAVRAYDPVAVLPPHLVRDGLTVHDSALQACEGADALAIMTPWREFKAVAAAEVAARLRGDIVIDPFAVLGHDAGASRLRVTRLGTGASAAEARAADAVSRELKESTC